MIDTRPSVTGVASGKGGVGKTLLASCLGSILTENRPTNGKVLLADLDFGVKGLTFLYGSPASWKDCSGSMIDILNQSKAPASVLSGARTFGDLVVIPSGVDFDKKDEWNANSFGYTHLVGSLGTFVNDAKKQNFDHVIFDTGAGLDQNVIALSEHADRIIIVAEPDQISLTAAVNVRAELLVRNHDPLFVINKEPEDFPNIAYKSLLNEGVKFLPSLPMDQQLHSRFVADARRLALEGFRRTRYKRFVGRIANEVFGISAKTPTTFDRIFRKTVTRIILRFFGYGIVFFLVYFLALLVAIVLMVQ